MKPEFVFSILLMMVLAPGGAFGVPVKAPQEPESEPERMEAAPGHAEVQFGSMRGGGGSLISMPPHLPPYLPNGAENLDFDWIEDGGARDYWNFVLIPQQLRMDGARWVDPALVPELFPPKKRQPGRRYYRRKPAHVAKAPVNASSTALKSPTIPLPVTPVEDVRSSDSIPPLRPGQVTPRRSRDSVRAPVAEEAPEVVPPRLQ